MTAQTRLPTAPAHAPAQDAAARAGDRPGGHPAATVRLFNTWTRRAGTFEPISPGQVGVYSCGPTVYDYQHIGNLRAYLFADLLRRVLLAAGYQVKHVVNITDVGHLTSDADTGEDKMERGARLQGKSAWELAEHFASVFKDDLRRLHVLEPAVWCKATDHIPQMIALIEEIERRGFTYRTADGIYFDTAMLPDYGHLARLDLAGQQAGARIGVNDEKRNPQDFALWKLSPAGQQRQMEWDSPWGTGFPGWHIECSAMSAQYLGVPFDIHTGGVDHIPVHHTNEIAQTRAATGLLLANWWLHGEFLNLKDRKMSKSAGGFITLQSLVDRGYEPLAYRFLTYQAHYRTQLAFTDEALDGAAQALRRLHDAFAALPGGEGEPDPAVLERFHEALRDDLNAPRALATVWEVAHSGALLPETKRATLLAMNAVMPMGLESVAAAAPEANTPPPEVMALLERRQAARKARDFAAADALRAEITTAGWELRDTPSGPELVRR